MGWISGRVGVCRVVIGCGIMLAAGLAVVSFGGLWSLYLCNVLLVGLLGVPHGHWNASTFIAGLRQDGLVAPCVFNGAINGELFLAYVEQVLVPTLIGGDIVGACQESCVEGHTVAPEGRGGRMTIRDEIIDELLSGEDPQAVFAKDGLLEALKKALAERILDAELEHHLRGERAQAGRGTPRNHRNGHSRKTMLSGSASWRSRCRATARRTSSRN